MKLDRPIRPLAVSARAWCDRLEPRLLFASLPAGFAETQVARGIDSPIAMALAPDGRMFVTEQDGAVRIIKDGTLLPTPFLSLATGVGYDAQGLCGIALDPNFQANGYVYIDYTVEGSTAFQRISRFTASGDTAVPGSEKVLLDVGPQTKSGHIGGALHFGGDGKLYFSYGDNYQGSIGLQLTNFYGKMIRINSDGSIPTDNPFYNQTTGVYRAIWAKGLRQAFTFAVQPGTGLMYINDVGDHQWEEIDQGIAGARLWLAHLRGDNHPSG